MFLSNEMLIQAPKLLRENQTLITAGAFVGQQRSLCWSVQKDGSVQPLPYLRSNAEETDLRIWLHCTRSSGSRKMLYSPDTDVYHIGLPIISHQLPQPDVYIQLHGRRKDSHRYLQVSAFLQAIDSDPDLAQVPSNKCANVVQMAYVSTGCDYISYFKGIGKVFFLNVLYQHATFITGGSDPVGTLADIHPDCEHLGLLAFVRLVGCAYFKKHLAGFKFSTPEALFHSITSPAPENHHKEWLNIIRTKVWERTIDESNYLPSYDALALHWKRSTWVANYWSKATENELQMPG